MTLRITGGVAKGRAVGSPTTSEVRPTGSKVRQAVFNILGSRIKASRFLDLFAGSGIMGIEALSRGAYSLTSIEMSRKLATAIEKSLEQLSLEADVITGDVRSVLQELAGEPYDIIFADPPYKSTLAKSVLQLVDRHKLLDEEGILIIEHETKLEFPLDEVSLKLSKKKTYGQTCLSLFMHATELEVEAS
ncbi:MAG: 16S rRNA (guanine(966)-N(2))-methyltransferase RsmD [Cyanobacteria bacterium]|nr:16S rRNA (guanine(966)-N(2))-methyltransferase RsmD [Cyanobacteriota bacterium]